MARTIVAGPGEFEPSGFDCILALEWAVTGSTDTKPKHQYLDQDRFQAVLTVHTDVVQVVLTIHTETKPELIQHEKANDNHQTAVIKTKDWINRQESDSFVALGSLPYPAQKRSLDP
ncbi:hypothetical protein DPMN_172151 [Dreissena polymorpha]|uniref:Uncharacterized protein n=1 Tax=Dreissena polymorpha TaxID=45954 RepID=A0A9D4IEU4_DREPO|nr:hypothetical protein DPMN_172151 [Dreissena polymorpha]